MQDTSVHVRETAPRALDHRAAHELLANACDHVARDVAAPCVSLAVAAAVGAAVTGSGGACFVVLTLGVFPAMYTALGLAIRRRRRRCRELGVDVEEADRLFNKVDLFLHVMRFHQMSAEEQARLVDAILAGQFTH